MDLQGKEESLPATSPSATEFNSYSTVSTNDSNSPGRIFNLPKSTNLINLPSAQHMNQAYEVPDPSRIPQSVFARTKSKSAQMEWSVTSNESLFSIHVAKPSDLPNALTDNTESLKAAVPNEITEGAQEAISGSLIETTESEQQDGDLNDKLVVDVNLSSTSNLNLNFNLSAFTTPCESPGSGMSGRHSETSTLSHNSFAFPVLTKDMKSKSVRNDLMHQLILKDRSLREPPFPETPISEKTVAQQNASWKSYFYCCSFTR